MPRPRNPHINETQLAIYLADGLTYSAIAARHGLTRCQVAGEIYRAGLTRDRQASMARRLDPSFRAAVLEDKRPNVRQVAKEWGITSATLSEWRRGLGA